jgi:hypothetical protein
VPDGTTRSYVITAESVIFNFTPYGTYHYASAFRRAAEVVEEPPDRYSPGPYFLYGHAIELALKAFLLAKRSH